MIGVKSALGATLARGAMRASSISLTAAHRALLLLARVSLDDHAREALRALAQARVDARLLAVEGRRHNVVPLLCLHRDELASLMGDSDELARLIAEARVAAAEGLGAAKDLAAILEAFRAVGIRARALKGPVAAAQCYGDVALRSFLDLDILVDPEQVAAAVAALERLGYAPGLPLSRADWTRMIAAYSQLGFSSGDGRYWVDLHWQLVDPGYTFTPEPRGPFARTESVRVGPFELPTLSVEATLLHLLLHGMKHAWHKLQWLCDVAELVRRHPNLDWGEVLSWSRQPGRSRLVDVGLQLVAEVLAAPVPSRALARGQSDPMVGRIADAVRRALFDTSPPKRGRLPETPFSVPYFLAMGTIADRIRFLHDVTVRPTPLEWRAVRLPPLLAPLYYVIRPLRLLAKHARPGRRQRPTS